MPDTIKLSPTPPNQSALLRYDGNVWVPRNEYSNVLDFGAASDGSAGASAAFEAANAAPGPILVPKGTYKIEKDLTISNGYHPLAGAVLQPAKGITIKLSGSLEVGLYQIFDTSLGGIVDVERGAVTEIMPQWWGARADDAHDDTFAIQEAINCAVRTDYREVYFPAGRYVFTRLYLHHDANHNPGFPPGGALGRIRLRGAARDKVARKGDSLPHRGTSLRSTDPKGPAIHFNGDPANEGRFTAMHVQLEELSVGAKNSTYVLDWYRAPSNSGFRRVTVIQQGAGGGIRWEDCWVTHMEEVDINGAGPKVSLNPGLDMVYPAGGRSGGFTRCDTVMIDNFRIGYLLGAEKFGEGQRMHCLHFRNCQAGICDIGVFWGHGVQISMWECCHCEGCTLGMAVQAHARNLTFMNCSWANNIQGIVLGTPHGQNQGAYSDIVIDNCYFIAENPTKEHIYIYGSERSGDCQNVAIRNCEFSHKKADQKAIHIEPTEIPGVQILFPSGAGTARIVNPDRAQLIARGHKWECGPSTHFVLPNVTEKDRGAAGNAGRIVFNTTSKRLEIDDGTEWVSLGHARK